MANFNFRLVMTPNEEIEEMQAIQKEQDKVDTFVRCVEIAKVYINETVKSIEYEKIFGEEEQEETIKKMERMLEEVKEREVET